MKLYYGPGACSMSCHITLAESGLPYEIVKLDIMGGGTETPEFKKLNPLGAVPALVLDGGKVLTQNLAIIVHVADLKPEAKQLPASGSFERAQALQWLSFVASDLHPAMGPLFAPDALKNNQEQVARVNDYLGYVERHLEGKKYLLGEHYSAADAYLYTVYSWTGYFGLPTAEFRNFTAYKKRMSERPAVQKVLKAEGLI